jgi:hypothetical protein
MKLAIAVALAIAAAACQGGAAVIDGDKLEAEIRSDLAKRKVVVRSVECPADQRVHHGLDFACAVVTDHQHVGVHVIQTDDGGSVIWEINGAAIDERALGEAVAAELHDGAKVACPHRTSIYTTGDAVTCPVTHPDGTVDAVAIAFTDNQGTYKWKLSATP